MAIGGQAGPGWGYNGGMPYLIDGHNVIGQMPNISLADPDDEVKLTALVRRLCAREQRKATLIFDGGLPGGVSKLSNADVTVIFASDRHTTADDLILNRIRDEKNPAGLIVVSSDQKIVNAARQRKMTVTPARDFGGQLLRMASAGEAVTEKEKGLSKEALAEWEALFLKRGNRD